MTFPSRTYESPQQQRGAATLRSAEHSALRSPHLLTLGLLAHILRRWYSTPPKKSTPTIFSGGGWSLGWTWLAGWSQQEMGGAPPSY